MTQGNDKLFCIDDVSDEPRSDEKRAKLLQWFCLYEYLRDRTPQNAIVYSPPTVYVRYDDFLKSNEGRDRV